MPAQISPPPELVPAPEQTPAKRTFGRPFAKGQSGNPNGRPKGLERQVREAVGDELPKLLDAILDIALARGPLCDATKGLAPKPADRIKAAELLLNRGWGAAKQTVSIETASPNAPAVNVAVNVLPDQDLAALERILAEADHRERTALETSTVIDVVPSPAGS